jgi:hypothetical protein
VRGNDSPARRDSRVDNGSPAVRIISAVNRFWRLRLSPALRLGICKRLGDPELAGLAQGGMTSTVVEFAIKIAQRLYRVHTPHPAGLALEAVLGGSDRFLGSNLGALIATQYLDGFGLNSVRSN